MLFLRNRLPYSILFAALAGCTTVGATGTTSSGCGPGGLNENQKAPGDQPGGVQVGMGDIAVAPGGDFVVFKRGDDLAVGWPATGRVDTLPVKLPSRLAFSKARAVVYVGSELDGEVHAIDVEARSELWSTPILDTFTQSMLIASSADDTRVVVSSWSEVVLLDAESGSTVDTTQAAGTIIDLDILPDDTRALIVPQHTWEADVAVTRMAVIELDTGESREIEVPNCADNVRITKGGARAFLAPTTCNQDPISYIDLAPGNEHFVRNLPGFGPLALGPEGAMAVGFLDALNVDASLFDDPSQIPEYDGTNQYYLMVLDTDALTYQFYPFGANFPRYTITPDGSVLLVDTGATSTARLFDTETGQYHEIQGPPIALENFVLTSDSVHAYALQNGLYDLNIDLATSVKIPVDFVPLNINIAPGDDTLYLRESDKEVCVFSLETRTCGSKLTSEPSI